MKTEILSLRVSRRAIGSAVLQPQGLALSDGRHIPSGATRAVAAATRYVAQLLRPSITAVVLDVPPHGVSATADRVLEAIIQQLADRRLTPTVIAKADVLGAYGRVALRTRGQVREIVVRFWPELESVRGRVKPYAIDAAAAALYGECRLALSASPP